MEPYLTAEGASGVAGSKRDSTAQLARDFAQALANPNIAVACSIVAAALADGASPGRVYVDVVRPALRAAAIRGQLRQTRLLDGFGQTLIGDLVGALTPTEGGGSGRTALLTCGELTMDRLDGNLVAAFLEADGWSVQRMHGPEAALAMGPASRLDGIELAVVVVSDAEAASHLASACTEMSRLPDPPVCLLCDFTGRADWPAASSGLGADALVSDPQELLEQAAHRLPAGGTRRWGVSVARRDDTLVLTPTGTLDATSAGRLAEMIQSRIGSFARLVVDLRDLAEISAAGIEGIVGWSQSGPLQRVELLLVGDAGVRARLDALGLAVPLADPALL